MGPIPCYYHPGAGLNLTCYDADVFVEIVRAFTPFTMGQVFVVRPIEQFPDLCLPLESFILKVYDPRFFRRIAFESSPEQPWDYEAEVEAAEKRQEQADSDVRFDPSQVPDDDDAVGWEEWYYQQAELAYRNELKAYRHLLSLQGQGVPRCYASGTLNVEAADPSQPRAISPHVLLIEYIPDAQSLRDIDPVSLTPMLIRSLIDTVSTFAELGVVHTDLNPGNILFSPEDEPERAVVIDFGSAFVREDESDEAWEEIVEKEADVPMLTKRLKHYLGVQDLFNFLAPAT